MTKEIWADPRLKPDRFDFTGEPLTEEDVETSKLKKSLDTDQKRIHWEAYAKKTERQEEVFKRVFNDVFSNQSREISDYYSKNGQLPTLNDEETAKRFGAAIQLVYEDAFEQAV